MIRDQQSMASRGFANDWVSTKSEGGEAKTMRRTLTLPALILIRVMTINMGVMS